MSEKQDTRDQYDLDEGIEARKPPKTSRKGRGDNKKQDNLLARIETAKSEIQTAKIEEAIAFADVASDDFIDLTDKFTALRIVEKTAGSIQRAGSLATNFLRSTPATGTYLEDALTSTIEMEDPFLALLTGS